MHSKQQKAKILSIAGSDSGGGAGIQADVKTITCLGGYASTAITAITAQNTVGVSAIHPVPMDIIIAQIDAVLSDIGADAIKIGMLFNPEIIAAVVGYLSENAKNTPIILDPVMIATSGSNLLEPAAIKALEQKLIPLCTLLTPNIPEAQILADEASENPEILAQKLYDKFGCNVLVKGGHSKTERNIIKDFLIFEGNSHIFPTKYIETKNTHGTGCTLSSAIATKFAQGDNLPSAVQAAQKYVHQAILSAEDIGQGNGPLKHNWTL